MFAYVDTGFTPVNTNSNLTVNMNVDMMQQQINDDLVRRNPEQLTETHALIREISEIRER